MFIRYVDIVDFVWCSHDPPWVGSNILLNYRWRSWGWEKATGSVCFCGVAGELGLRRLMPSLCLARPWCAATEKTLAFVMALQRTLSEMYYILPCLLKQRAPGVGSVWSGTAVSWWIKVALWTHIFLSAQQCTYFIGFSYFGFWCHWACSLQSLSSLCILKPLIRSEAYYKLL